MPRLLYALTAVILSYGPSFAATENELRSADVIMPGCRQLSETTPAVSINFSTSRSVRYSRGRLEGLRTVTFTDLGAQEMTAVFSMVSPIAEYQLLQFYIEL
ncbi:MAG: hypothetical protein WA366_22600 [Pseudolabrys sp.]